MSEKLGQEQAFADEYNSGMSKRFYAACVAMQGMITQGVTTTTEDFIETCYVYADELLKQENL